MAWPRGKSRKEYNAEKKAADEAAKEVMPSEQDNAKPASQSEVRAQPRTSVPPTRRVVERVVGGKVETSDLLAGRANFASMKAAPNKAADWRMRAGNSWEEIISADNEVNILNIPMDVWPEGMVFFWQTRSIRGQDMSQTVNGAKKQGWQVVHDEDFQGSSFYEYARSRWTRDDSGFIVHEACILMATSIERWMQLDAAQKKAAKEQLLIREQAITGGNMNATGARDPAALNFNKITRTVERLEIPKD